MKKFNLDEVKIIQIGKGVYQVEAGKKAVVIPAKSRSDAIKIACEYLPINCNELRL